MKQIPNALTVLRCLLAGVVGWVILVFPVSGLSALWPLVLFAAVAGTDFVDGYLARKLDARSSFGAFLDPVADKLLVAACLLALCVRLDWFIGLTIPTVIIIVRDGVVTALRLVPSVTLRVSTLAKWKTALEMFGIGFVLSAPIFGLSSISAWIGIVGIAIIAIAAALSAYTLILYAETFIRTTKRPR